MAIRGRGCACESSTGFAPSERRHRAAALADSQSVADVLFMTCPFLNLTHWQTLSLLSNFFLAA